LCGAQNEEHRKLASKKVRTPAACHLSYPIA